MELKPKRKIYKRWWFWVAVFIIFAVYSVVSDQNPTSNKTVSSPVPSQTANETTSAQTAKSSIDPKKIDQYLKDNFAGTPWYDLIQSIAVNGTSVDVHTSIYPDSEGRQTAKQMVGILYGNLKSQFPDVSSVTIIAKNGGSDDPIAWKSHY